MAHQIIKKYIYYKYILIIFTLWSSFLAAQSGERVSGTFGGSRVINGHSVEQPNPGEMEFIISHRFGRVNGGLYEFLGLDESTIRFGLEYAPFSRIFLGVGRSSFEKTY